jgi:uncharacterized protein DUF6259
VVALLLQAAWMPAASAAAENSARSPSALKEAGVSLKTGSARFELTSPAQGLLLRSLVDVATGTEFLPQAGGGLSLWEVVLLNPQRKLVAVRAQPGAEYKTSQKDGATVHHLGWPRLDLPGEAQAIGVEVSVTVSANDRWLSEWRIRVTNRSKVWGVWEVRFPRLERLGPVGDPAGDRFLDPMIQGRLTPNPYRHLQKARYVRDAPVETSGQSVHYPGYASFQMCSLYHPDRAGLYYAAHDGKGYFKRFCFSPNKDGRSLDLYLQHSPEGQGLAGAGYVSPFPVVIGAFKGDWMTAAKRYRQWAVKQVWCSGGPLERRADVPDWYKKLAIWEFITGTSYGAMRHYRRKLGVPWANHWNYIWKDKSQGDRGSPDLFPPKGGAEQMRRETARLTKAGVYTVPYFLGSAVDCKSPQYAKWDMDPVLVRGGEARYALGNPNTPYIWVYHGGTPRQVRYAWPCPHLDFWPSKAEKVVRRIMELGATGVYLDTTTGNAYQCFSTEHGHPAGGGNYWAQGVRRYLKRVRRTVKAVNPQGIMTGENPCEVYMDLMDGFLLFVAHFPTHVPAFQAIYGDYIGTYGQSLSSPAKIGKDYPFMLPMGISFINGDQVGHTARTDYTMQAPGAADMAWLRRLAHFRVKAVNRYVGLGEMVRPPTLETKLPEVSGWWWAWNPKQWITRTVTRPAVIHSAWRASDGSIGIVFLNISEQAQQVAFRLRGDQYGFAPGADLAIAGLGLDRHEKLTRDVHATLTEGKGRIEHTLKPRGMWALEIRPTKSER